MLKLISIVFIVAIHLVDTIPAKAADDFSTKFKITTKRSDDKVDLYAPPPSGWQTNPAKYQNALR